MMGKIVGNVLFLFLLCCGVIHADISLRILDTDRSPLVEAAAGRPFLIEVSIHDAHNVEQPPVVQGLDQFVIQNTSVRIATINSKITAKYTYKVSIDTPGTYTIGPAVVNQESSHSLRIIVGNEQIESVDKHEKKEAPVLLRLLANKDRAVVGEPVHCWLRFFYTDPTITLRHFIENDSKDMRRKKMIGPHNGTQALNGINYQYVEWEFDIVPQKIGRSTIPAFGADYDQEVEERDNFWGGLGRFLGNLVATKRIYSNALSLEVDPLPESEKLIQAIGHFSAITVSAKPAIAKQGEGIVVTVEIVGDGDPDAIEFSTFENMPAALRFYESNQTVVEPTKEGELPKKRFEFIVQGLKVGTWEIPSQSFYYFDTKLRKFTTLNTVPLSITIMPTTKKTVTIKDNDDEQGATHEYKDDIAPLHKEWSYIGVPEWRLPWWLFIIMVLVPIIFLLYEFVSRIFLQKQQGSYGARRAKKAFGTAKKRLEIIKKHDNSHELYTLFVELFADRWQISIASISAEEIKERLSKKGFDATKLNAWDDFFARIAERAFGVKKIAEDKYLFEKAEQWIEELERFL